MVHNGMDNTTSRKHSPRIITKKKNQKQTKKKPKTKIYVQYGHRKANKN